MSREGQTILYTGAEAQAWHMLELERGVLRRHRVAIHERHQDNRETQDDLNRMSELENAVLNEHTAFIHARLTRVLPHLADVITYLLWSEFMETPEWVDQTGSAQPYRLPPQHWERA